MYDNQQPTTTPPGTPIPDPVPVSPSSPTPTPSANRLPIVKLLIGLSVTLVIILILVIILLNRTPADPIPEVIPSPSPVSEAPPTDPSSLPAAQLERSQLTATPRGQVNPQASPLPSADDPGVLVQGTETTDTQSLTALGPGAIIFGDYAFTIFQGQLIKIPLTCPSTCQNHLTLNLKTYQTPGAVTPRALSFPLVQGQIAGPNQVMLYENDDHERIIADVIFSLLENRRDSQSSSRDSYNFGTVTPQGLYLFVDNAPTRKDGSEELVDTVSVYLMTQANSVPALLYDKFSPSVAYAGQLYDGEPMELFYESTLQANLGLYTHSLHIYFPQQNLVQEIFRDLSLLGITKDNQLVIYYPRTAISSPQIGLITINPTLHGIKGNQIIIAPQDMPSEDIPDYADGHFYFVTAENKVYHSTLDNPYPTLAYDFSNNFRTKDYQLTNWWYTKANNNHPGVCLCSEKQVQRTNTGAFYDFQLGQFIESLPECTGRPEIGTWYCS